MPKPPIVIYKDGFPEDFRDTMITKFKRYWRVVDDSVIGSCKLPSDALDLAHAEAYSEFAGGPLFAFPDVADPAARAEYFRRCDEICDKQPKTPRDHVMATFAGMAAISVLQEQDVREYILEHGELAANDIFVRPMSAPNPALLRASRGYDPRAASAPHSPDSLFSEPVDGRRVRSPADFAMGEAPPASSARPLSEAPTTASHDSLFSEAEPAGIANTRAATPPAAAPAATPPPAPSSENGEPAPSSAHPAGAGPCFPREPPALPRVHNSTEGSPGGVIAPERAAALLDVLGSRHRCRVGGEEVEFAVVDCAVTILQNTRLYVLRWDGGRRQYVDELELESVLSRSIRV